MLLYAATQKITAKMEAERQRRQLDNHTAKLFVINPQKNILRDTFEEIIANGDFFDVDDGDDVAEILASNRTLSGYKAGLWISQEAADLLNLYWLFFKAVQIYK